MIILNRENTASESIMTTFFIVSYKKILNRRPGVSSFYAGAG